MSTAVVEGRIHSLQSLGTVDGPGVRFVVFMQGCMLRCGCCHNPDSWDIHGGTICTPQAILQKVLRYREYFGTDGGVTVSGGEPLLQAAFVKELFTLCRNEEIHTCLDTSGAIMNDAVKELIAVTDRILLDIKYTDAQLYRKHVGCEMESVLSFLQYADEQKVPVTLRQVVIPSLNDTEENIRLLREIADQHNCVDGIELLPFHKMCETKYRALEIPFRFAHISEPSAARMSELEALLIKY